MIITLNVPALLGVLLSVVGGAMLATVSLGAVHDRLAWLGIALLAWGHLAVVECRIARHAQRTAATNAEEREACELVAYERGRLRGI